MGYLFILLLAASDFAGAVSNFGYLECRHNLYEAKCIGEFVRLHREDEGLTVFPEVTSRQTCVQLKNNEIARFPNDLRTLQHVVTLDLSYNAISAVPNNLDTLNSLEILDLSHNRVRTLSSGTRFPASLRGLLLAGNGISTIPAGFRIPSLFVLDLSQNAFTELPAQFCVSNQLIRMDLNDNPLDKDISHYIGSLNTCRNSNKIPFCLFTDYDFIKCNCSVLESLMFDQPAFLLGSASDNRAEMVCSQSDSREEFTGRKLFDLDVHAVGKQCNIAARTVHKSPKSNGVTLHDSAVLAFLCVILSAVIVMVE